MRVILSTSLIAAAVLAAGAVQAAPKEGARLQLAAYSATDYGVQAAHTGAQLDVGYSSSSRRIADCLASFSGYNPKTDMIWVRAGAKQRCPL